MSNNTKLNYVLYIIHLQINYFEANLIKSFELPEKPDINSLKALQSLIEEAEIELKTVKIRNSENISII